MRVAPTVGWSWHGCVMACVKYGCPVQQDGPEDLAQELQLEVFTVAGERLCSFDSTKVSRSTNVSKLKDLILGCLEIEAIYRGQERHRGADP